MQITFFQCRIQILHRLIKSTTLILCLLKTLVIWPRLFNPSFITKNGPLFIRRDTEITSTNLSRSNSDSTSNGKSENLTYKMQIINSAINGKSIYGSQCPFNPHKETLKYLFNYWMLLDNYYNISSFICGGSLIGSLRDGDLIPYDRDLDVCVTLKNYQKVRLIRSGKPFHPHSRFIYLAIQEDFWNNDVNNRTRVDCKGLIVSFGRDIDQCSFDTPGARLISRGVYLDVFVFRDQGMYLRDHEYQKDLLKSDIFPLKDCMFMGIKTKCPRNEMQYLLKYYEDDVLTKPHYVCRNKTWVATSRNATEKFEIWFDKVLTYYSNHN
ncbi:uncharacterized protein LOC114521910 [Dendronephthya gigantea]|uniref:uncharacterized protein LOC114521910 n=1 Tax=Dendronephthya gigantea TaxID=151771 RepID=UPI00106A3C95|nr:uncharacterized protein LOC114521910 [Dendronephthya gigantea]